MWFLRSRTLCYHISSYVCFFVVQPGETQRRSSEKLQKISARHRGKRQVLVMKLASGEISEFSHPTHVRPSFSRRVLSKASLDVVHINVKDLPHTKPAWIGSMAPKEESKGTLTYEQKEYSLQELVDKKHFKVLKWDGL